MSYMGGIDLRFQFYAQESVIVRNMLLILTRSISPRDKEIIELADI